MDYFELLQLPAKVDLSRLEIDKQYRTSFAAANSIEDSQQRNQKLAQINTARQAIIDIRVRLKLLLARAGITINENQQKVPQTVLIDSFQMREHAETLQDGDLKQFITGLKDKVQNHLARIQVLLQQDELLVEKLIASYYSFVYDSKLLDDLSIAN